MLSRDKSIFLHRQILISYFLLTTSILVSTSTTVLSSPVALLLFQAAYLGHRPPVPPPKPPPWKRAAISPGWGNPLPPHVSDACSAQRSWGLSAHSPHSPAPQPKENRRSHARTATSPHAAFYTCILEDLLAGIQTLVRYSGLWGVSLN